MNTIEKENIVRLVSGELCKVIGLPGTFMSRGCYEVIEGTIDNRNNFILPPKKKASKWVKPEEIAYKIFPNTSLEDYFEIIHDEEIQMIPKKLIAVELVEANDFKTLRLLYENNVVNILLGNTEIKIIKNETR